VKKLIPLLLAITLAWPALAATQSVTFAVQGWTCGSCAAATRIALKKLDGVEGVTTDHGKMEAVVTYDDSKVTPEKMIQAIQRLGYKAVKAAAPPSTAPLSLGEGTALSASPSSERISFFEAPLSCCAAEGLGCGSLSKPILKELERDARVAEAKINYPGTVLAVVWKDPEQAHSGTAAVSDAFKKRELEAKPLRGASRDRALKDFGAGQWYGASDVDRLSEREAQLIASRLVARAKSRLGLTPERLAALTHDLSAVFARHLTRDADEECPAGKDAIEQELTKAASKHLNSQQLAELRKAGEQGIQALPGEAR
jgi:mercuric ion binding protein